MLQHNTSLRRSPELASWWSGSTTLLRAAVLEVEPVDAYDAFLTWKFRDINQYNCWHEDRTAGGNGIEARVPYLDPRLVDFTTTLPRHERPRLLWDKHLLRESVRRRGILPAAVVNRPKEPFYDGRSAGGTHRVFRRLVSADDYALVDAATASPAAKEFIDADGVRAAVRELEAGRGNAHIEILLRVLNLGLLDGMLQELPPPLPTLPGGPKLTVLRTRTVADRAAEASALVLLRAESLADAVLVAADDTFVVSRPAAGEHYVVRDGTLRYVLDDAEDAAMIALLEAVDGVRTLAAVSAAIDIPLEELERLAQQALDAHAVQRDPVR